MFHRGAGNGAVTRPNGAHGPLYAYLGCPVAGGWCSSALILSRCAAARLSYPPVTWWLGSRTRALGSHGAQAIFGTIERPMKQTGASARSMLSVRIVVELGSQSTNAKKILQVTSDLACSIYEHPSV